MQHQIMAYALLINNYMKAVLISNDYDLINIVKNMELFPENNLSIFSDQPDTLEIMSFICTLHPSLLLMDDDFVKPNTVNVLNALRKVNKKLKIIFITSNSGIELGRSVSPLGIHYYMIKPVNKFEIKESIESLIK